MKHASYRDPITGDALTRGEYVSWKIQAVIRRWTFLGIISALTAYVWIFADPIWRHPVTDQWNLWASWLAIAIESVTAMALINQTRRDAVVSRETRGNSERIEKLAEAQAEATAHLERVEEQNTLQLQQIAALLEHARTGMLPGYAEEEGGNDGREYLANDRD